MEDGKEETSNSAGAHALKHVPAGESRCPVLVAPAFTPSTSSLDEWVTG